MQDSQIIALYFERDERAIEETATKYGAYLYTIAKNILLDTFDSEECVNDTYVRTWNTIPPTHPTRFSAFLGKITRNIALDRYKEKNAEKRGGRVAASLDELGECVGLSGELTDELEYRELTLIINRFLRKRKPIARKIFILRYFHQYSIVEIAKLHNVGESYVKTTLYREREALADLFRREGVNI